MRRPWRVNWRINLFIVIALALAFAFSLHAPRLSVDAASMGSTSLITVQGSGTTTDFGDYVSSSGGLNTVYRTFIEVPPGLSRLVVDIFDPDIGLGGSSEATAGRDRARNGFDSSASYTLFNPSGQQRPTVFTSGDATAPAGSDNA